MKKHIILITALTASITLAYANANANANSNTNEPSALSKTWNNLWQSTSQQAQTAFNKGDFSRASKLFGESTDNIKNQNWQASSNYKAGNYEESADLFKLSIGQQQNYNLGNALAKSGNLQGALDAYERHLTDNPNDEDAKFNRDLVKKLLDEQKKKDKQDKKDGKKDSDKNNDKKDKQNKDKNDNQNSQDKQNSKDKEDSQNSEQDTQGNKKEDKKGDGQKDKQDEKEKRKEKAKEKDGKENTGKNDTNKEGTDKEGNTEDKQPQSIKSTPKPLDQATEQTLRRVPDDSSGLLRARIMQYYREQGR